MVSFDFMTTFLKKLLDTRMTPAVVCNARLMKSVIVLLSLQEQHLLILYVTTAWKALTLMAL